MKLTTSFVNKRPVEDVFAFVSDRENDPQWDFQTVEVEKTSEGPIGAGTTWRQVTRILGQKSTGNIVLSECEEYRKVTTKSQSGSIPVTARMTFEPVEAGTRLGVDIQVKLGGILGLAEPLAVRTFKGQLESSFANLKKLLEAQP